MFLEGAPVTAIHGDIVAHVERAGDDLAAALGEHETEIRRKAPLQLIEELLGQILPPVIQPIDVIFVEAKHRAQVFLRELLAFVGADRDPAFFHFAPLALDLVAPVAAKAAKIIVEGMETAVLPVILNARAWEKTDCFQRLALVGKTKINMHRRDFVVGGDLRQRLSQETNELQRGLRRPR